MLSSALKLMYPAGEVDWEVVNGGIRKLEPGVIECRTEGLTIKRWNRIAFAGPGSDRVADDYGSS